LEREKDRGVFGPNDVFVVSYLYCLKGSVEKAETLVADNRCLNQEGLVC
jgi:hypothetical protein